MPQMATLSWFILFMFFIGIFLLFNMVNYSLYLSYPSVTLKLGESQDSTTFIWKW